MATKVMVRAASSYISSWFQFILNLLETKTRVNVGGTGAYRCRLIFNNIIKTECIKRGLAILFLCEVTKQHFFSWQTCHAVTGRLDVIIGWSLIAFLVRPWRWPRCTALIFPGFPLSSVRSIATQTNTQTRSQVIQTWENSVALVLRPGAHWWISPSLTSLGTTLVWPPWCSSKQQPCSLTKLKARVGAHTARAR